LVGYLVLAVGVLAAAASPATGASVIFGATVTGVGLAQIGLLGHDASHLAIFRRAWANWLYGQMAMTLTLGLSFWYWRDRHLRHHVNTNDELDDPDLNGAGVFAFSETQARARTGFSRIVVRYQAYLIVPAAALLFSPLIRLEGWLYASRRLRGRRRAAELLRLGASLVVWLAPTYWLGPTWLGTYLLAHSVAGAYSFFVIAPNHKGLPVWAHGVRLTFLERQVLGSRNVRPSPIVDYVFGGLNYQIEHHLFPSMPRANLASARKLIRPFCARHGLPYDELPLGASLSRLFREMHGIGRVDSHASELNSLVAEPRETALGSASLGCRD
jgi:fatty acid desaturase